MVPEQKHPCQARENGTADVVIPRYGKGAVGRALSSLLKDTPIRIHLDRIGARTWMLCDGCRSVREIGEALQREFGEEIEPVYERLAMFFKQMERREMIRWKESDSQSRS